MRYEIELGHSEGLSVVIHNTGRRDLFYRGPDDDEYKPVVELSDAQARALGLFLVGAYYQPVPAQAGEQTPTEETARWYSVVPESAADGTEIGALAFEAETGGEILAVVRSGTRTANPDDAFELSADDHVLIIGDGECHTQAETILEDPA